MHQAKPYVKKRKTHPEGEKYLEKDDIGCRDLLEQGTYRRDMDIAIEVSRIIATMVQ